MMAAGDEPELPDSSAPVPPCSLRHQRLRRLEELAAKTAVTVHGHTVTLLELGERIKGLAHAHDATLIAVRASTDASTRLSNTLERVDEKMDELIGDFVSHKIAGEKEQRSLPRLALRLWGASILFAASALLWIATNWQWFVNLFGKSG
jgi:hypothetical protein